MMNNKYWIRHTWEQEQDREQLNEMTKHFNLITIQIYHQTEEKVNIQMIKTGND